MTTDLKVPYFWQGDNRFNPSGACNVTSVAMCLSFFGIAGDLSQPQLEDQMYQRCIDNGWSRHTPSGLKSLVESYPGCKDDLTTSGSLSDIREALDKGWPCIVHGYFTGFGHIIVVRGYDQPNFLVNDPHGEWSPWSYDVRPRIGERLRYSKRAISACCDSFSQGEAIDRYARMTDAQVEAANSIWLHRIHREQ